MDVSGKLGYRDQVEKRCASASACAALLGYLVAASAALLLLAGCVVVCRAVYQVSTTFNPTMNMGVTVVRNGVVVGLTGDCE